MDGEGGVGYGRVGFIREVGESQIFLLKRKYLTFFDEGVYAYKALEPDLRSVSLNGRYTNMLQ